RRFGRGLGSRCRNGTDALLLRIALGKLVGTLEVLIGAHDQMPKNPVGVLHAAIELSERAVTLEDEEVVVAFGELLDGIRETAAAPRFFVFQRGTGLLGNAAELGRERRGFLLRNLRREDEQDF